MTPIETLVGKDYSFYYTLSNIPKCMWRQTLSWIGQNTETLTTDQDQTLVTFRSKYYLVLKYGECL